MTQEQQVIIEKNEALFNAYDAVLNATLTNNTTFAEMCEMLITLHSIKTKPTTK